MINKYTFNTSDTLAPKPWEHLLYEKCIGSETIITTRTTNSILGNFGFDCLLICHWKVFVSEENQCSHGETLAFFSGDGERGMSSDVVSSAYYCS